MILLRKSKNFAYPGLSKRGEKVFKDLSKKYREDLKNKIRELPKGYGGYKDQILRDFNTETLIESAKIKTNIARKVAEQL